MRYDLVVVGAGPAGLSLARALAGSGLSMALVEASPRQTLADPPYDGREIALTHLSREILQQLGIWQHFPTDAVGLIRKAQVFSGSSPYSLDFDHRQTSRDTLGYMVSNQWIRRACFQAVAEQEGVYWLDGCKVERVQAGAEGGQVHLADGRVLAARLVVAADSRFSASRRQMGIATDMLDFGRTCVVCNMSVERHHRHTAWECFHDDRTLAVLPLAGRRVSVVITLPAEQTDELLALSAEALAEDTANRIQHALGRMRMDSERYAYPLVATLARSFCKPGFVLMGDAAVGMHPVTAHGYNLGLQGAWTLAQAIHAARARGEDWASASLLQGWARQHRRTAAPIWHGTNAVVKLFNDNRPLARVARAAALRAGNHVRPLRRFILNRLTEIQADRPTWVRGLASWAG